jgi:hypothetical protein
MLFCEELEEAVTNTVTREACFRRMDARVALAAALCALLLVAFCAVPYLPMVDLPQHAAQISLWQRLDSPTGAPLFELNLRTPYLGAYVAARVLAPWLGAVLAVKVVVWLSVVAHLFAFDLLVRTLGHPRWLGLLGLPLGLGYGFYYGFISFIAALPLGLLAVSAALRHRGRPTLLSGSLLAAALCATLATHGFAFGMTLLMVLPLLLRGAGGFFGRVVPVVAPALLAVVWLLPGTSARSIGLTIWEPRFFDLAQVPALLLAASAADHVATAFGVLFLLLLALTFGRPSRAIERYLPLILLVLGYCVFPLMLGGFGPLHPRFAAFMVPALLLAFEPGAEHEHSLLPGLVAATTVAWLGLFVHRLSAFEAETRPVADFVARMPEGLSIRPIVFERTSEVFPDLPVLLHLSAYYLPEKAGRQGYSFAMYPTSVIRNAPSVVPTMDSGAEWHPESFSAQIELDRYDCFLVHSDSDRSVELFGDEAPGVSLAFHEGSWWAYLTRSALTALTAYNREGSRHEQPLVVSRSK